MGYESVHFKGSVVIKDGKFKSTGLLIAQKYNAQIKKDAGKRLSVGEHRKQQVTIN